MQILKDYHLYQDLSRLNNDQYFHYSFETPELMQTVGLPCNHSEYVEHHRNIGIFCYNLRHTNDKNVYIVTKWLITTHRIIKNVQYSRIMREIEEALAAITQVKIKSKYDSYLLQKLVKPYRHYLQKLCLLYNETSGGKAGDYKKSKVQIEQEWFLKYNLVKYALNQFCPFLAEFMGFFKISYPFLARLSTELGSDIQRFMKELKSAFKIHDINSIQKNDLQGFQESFSKMSEIFSPSNELLFFTESEFCNLKVKDFFESGIKGQGTVLFA